MALKISVLPLKMMKELNCEKSVESLFLELISLENGGRGGFHLLATLLKSQSTPFRRQYLKFCETYTVFGFLGIQKYSRKYRSLDISQIISPDCISASKIEFGFDLYEDFLISFFKRRGSSPILSKNYKPSQWSDKVFFSTIRQAVDMNLKPDWNSWCGDVNIHTNHFSQHLWNSDDKLWRLLNYKCIKRMTKSNRIMMRVKFLEIFKPNQDSAREALMKIISLTASFQTLRSLNVKFPKENPVIQQHLNMLLYYITSKCQASSIIASTASRLIKHGVFVSNDMATRKIISELFLILKDEPAVNSSWLLNLIYLALRSSQFMISDSTVNRIINWFFSLNPSIPNTCQLLEIINSIDRPELMKTTIGKIGNDRILISDVYKECPAIFKSMRVPFETRLKLFMVNQRTFPRQVLTLKIPFSRKNDFSFLLDVILDKEPIIFTQNHVTFETGYNNFIFQNLETFFVHFLETFLSQQELYLLIGYKTDGRIPVIVLSLKVPKRVVFILMSVLIRSLVLNFKVPFHLHWEYFSTVFLGNNSAKLSKSLRLKKLFYNDKHNTRDIDLIECEKVNKNVGNKEMLFEYLRNANTRSPIQTQVSYLTLLNLIEAQLHSVAASIANVFTAEVPFKSRDIYHLIFK